MTYSLGLFETALVVGVILVLGHLAPLASPATVRGILPRLPRSRIAGTVLFGVAALWCFLLVRTMDLGEFAGLRNVMLMAIAVGAVLIWKLVDEFLAVRALGILALLSAEPLLCAAFLQEPATRLFLVILAYAWIVAGMFWAGMPYLLRDQIQWVCRSDFRLRFAALGGVLYGVLLIVCAFLFFR
jgi:hypothetical protein